MSQDEFVVYIRRSVINLSDYYMTPLCYDCFNFNCSACLLQAEQLFLKRNFII